ncbi:response regulator [Verrucomicrobia bacterium]|nr:response regulator [Verrucomicrobiota bacterium]MDB4652261.1 response regulator [Verrucomicrobiota bacterium]
MFKDLKQAKILIIDDNASNVEQLHQLLEFHDFSQIESTTDSRQVESLIKIFEPDILLLDLQMPFQDGFQILEMLNHKIDESDFVPVIVLTADISTEARERALKLGAMDFLTKPFDFTEVIQRITNLLRTRYLHLQLHTYNDLLEEKVQERTAELKKAQDELIAQERMKAMGQMASGIAHDFNNSISTIMGYSEIFLTFPDKLDDRDELMRAFKIINKGCNDAASIVQRLRELYKHGQEEEGAAIADLAAAANEIILMTKPKWKAQALAAGRNISIQKELEKVEVCISPSKVREILVNLFFNAIDAIQESGEITLRSRPESSVGVIEIRDTGIGMSESVRQKCMEMFFSTKGSDGTGIGLGVVHAIVKKHRGSIKIESKEGSGTTVALRFPLAKANNEGNQMRSKGEEVFHSNFKVRILNILLVDDEKSNADILAELLSKDGHQVIRASNGRDAFVAFLSESIDLVITDLAMPHVNGAQLTRAIRQRDWNGPIIMITGFADQIKSQSSQPEGISALLGKPVNYLELRETVSKLF